MRAETLSPAQHKLTCIGHIARAELDDARRVLLLNVVETYLQLEDDDQAEYDRLVEEDEDVKTIETTWADRMQLLGYERGVQER